MNTIKSVYYGWGTLIVAGGGAYYFAKKSINADRAAKAQAEHEKRLAHYQLEQAYNTRASNPAHENQSQSNVLNPRGTITPPARGPVTSEIEKRLGKGKEGKKEMEQKDKDEWGQADDVASPSHEASHDPAPTRHEPEDEAQKVKEKSKYEASDVYRRRRGDRFS